LFQVLDDGAGYLVLVLVGRDPRNSRSAATAF
jgi:hypothetical protein